MQHVGWDRRGRALVFSDIGLARDKAPSTNVEHCTQVRILIPAPWPDTARRRPDCVCVRAHTLAASSSLA